MNINQTKNDNTLLIVQIEPPQKEDGGDYYYRTHAPGIAMAQEDGIYVINLTNVHRKKNELIHCADVLILKNICDIDILPFIKDRKKQKKLTIYELADDLCAIPTWNPVHFFFKSKENQLIFKRIASLCDAMQFSVPELSRIYNYLNPTSIVFPNQITTVPSRRKLENREKITIGWGGSHGHLEDLAEVAKRLVDFLISNKQLRLHLMSSDAIWRLFDRLPLSQKQRFKPGSISDYYAYLKTIDIGFAPLKNSAFNRSRSDVKLLEFSTHGVVPVVQALTPYTATVEHGRTGFLYEDVNGLIAILDMLSNNVDLLNKIAKAAYDYVIKHRLQHKHAKERIDFYRKRLDSLRNGQAMKGSGHRIFKSYAGIEGAVATDHHLKLMSTHFEKLLHDGLILSQIEGKAQVACSLFDQASRLEPDNYLPYLFGHTCTKNPVETLQLSINKNTNSLKSWILMGEQFARQGNAYKAFKCFDSAATIFPEYEIPYLRSAELLRKLGRYDESISLTKKAEALIQAF